MSWTYTNPIQPSPDESCDASKNYKDGFFTPAGSLVETSNFGRLIWPLRAAATTDPATMLALSSACYAMASLPAGNLLGAVPPEPPFPPKATPSAILSGGLSIVGANRSALAQAFADLCASGRNAYGLFTGSPPAQGAVASAASSLLAGVNFGGAVLQTAVQSAFSRANAVASCVGAIQPSKTVRAGLGWIALSAEDDPPRRPVNISALLYPQYDLAVSVPTQSGPMTTVEARYVVISDEPAATPEPVFAPDGHILLFIHGDGSRCEEVDPLVAPLLAAGTRRGHPYTILPWICLRTAAAPWSIRLDRRSTGPRPGTIHLPFPYRGRPITQCSNSSRSSFWRSWRPLARDMGSASSSSDRWAEASAAT
jgi:hypothetical protein